jgi:hypothetical protein
MATIKIRLAMLYHWFLMQYWGLRVRVLSWGMDPEEVRYLMQLGQRRAEWKAAQKQK